MSDSLFDASTYGHGRTTRAKPEVDDRTVPNDGRWFVITRRGRTPHDFTHRVDPTPMLRGVPPRDEGARRALCGLIGRPILIEGSIPVRPCPKCEKR